MATPQQAEFWNYDPNPYVFFGYLGITAALVFGNLGAAYGTARSGIAICEVSSKRIDLMFKSIIPVVMAGILGIYGLIVAVLFSIASLLDLRHHSPLEAVRRVRAPYFARSKSLFCRYRPTPYELVRRRARLPERTRLPARPRASRLWLPASLWP